MDASNPLPAMFCCEVKCILCDTFTLFSSSNLQTLNDARNRLVLQRRVLTFRLLSKSKYFKGYQDIEKTC